MGILKLLTFYRKHSYSNVSELRRIINLIIDLDEIIHQKSQFVYKYGLDAGDKPRSDRGILHGKILDEIRSELNKLLNNHKPNGSLVIVSNGSVPNAKLYQERCLRFKAASEKTNGFDVSNITSGTLFMRSVNEMVNKWIDDNESRMPPKVIYSSDMVPGEAIHKIYGHMTSREIPMTGVDNGETLIISSDPALIPLASLSGMRKVYLKQLVVIRRARTMTKKYDYISIDRVMEYAHGFLGEKESSVRDFMLLLNLFGNAYIPSLPMLNDTSTNSFNYIKEAYQQLGSPITEMNGDIIWENFKKFIEKLAEIEEEALKSIYQEQIGKMVRSQTSKVLSQSSSISTYTKEKTVIRVEKETLVSNFDYPSFRSNWYHNIFGPRGTSGNDKTMNFAKKVLNKNKIKVVTEEKINKLCMDYLIGIYWCNEYMFNGPRFVDLSWQYKYYHTPLLRDLVRVLNVNPKIEGYKTCGKYFIDPLTRLICVIPKTSFALLPAKMDLIFGANYKGLGYMFPIKIAFESDGSDVEVWNWIPLLPIPDPMEVSKWISSNELTREEADFYRSQNIKYGKQKGIRMITRSSRIKERTQKSTTARGRAESVSKQISNKTFGLSSSVKESGDEDDNEQEFLDF